VHGKRTFRFCIFAQQLSWVIAQQWQIFRGRANTWVCTWGMNARNWLDTWGITWGAFD